MKLSARSDDSNRAPIRMMNRLQSLPTSVRWVCLGFLILALTAVAWLSIEAYKAKSNLEQARSSAMQSKEALLAGNAEDASQFAKSAQTHASQARTATHSLPWNIAAAVPLIGSPLKTTQQISDVVAGLADEVLLPAAKMGAGISPDKLVEGTRIDLKLLRAEQPQLTELSKAATSLDAKSQAISKPAFSSLIADVRSQLQTQTSKLAQFLKNTALAAQLAPSMLGADGPRTYLMAFQTPAEARGTGGLVGGFGILRFDNGTPTVDALASNTEFDRATATVTLDPEFERVYGWANPLTDFRNSNLSPHFPYAAQIWQSMWEQQTGVKVDGVIALDPVALSYILGATGPVVLADGETINADNVVELTMSKAYARFPTDFSTYESSKETISASPARKKYLLSIANAVASKMTGSLPSPRALIDALGRAAGQGRIAVWSSFPAEQQLLEQTPLGHAIPNDDAPYVQVVINNLAGNKMDYYLKREIEYVADGCDGATRNSTVSVTLSNTAPSDKRLPDDVASTLGLDPAIPLEVPPGTMVSSVRVITTKGSRLMNVTAKGEPTRAVKHIENGHPSFEVQVAIPPGQSGELVFRLSEPTSQGEPRMTIQPLIDNLTPQLSVPACS